MDKKENSIMLEASDIMPCGAFGCFLSNSAFVKLVKKLETLGATKMEKISFKEVKGKIEPITTKTKEISETLKKFNIPADTSFKVIYNYKHGEKAFTEELEAAAKLYSVMGPGGINQNTTLRIIKKDPSKGSKDMLRVIGFKIIFNKPITIYKRGKGGSGNFETDKIGVIINQKCETDLKKAKNIDFNKFLSDITSVMTTYLDEGYVHKDIKPDNMVLCKTKEGCKYKLIDWGLMKDLDESRHALTMSGTPLYMSPAIAYYGSDADPFFFKLRNNRERVLFREEHLEGFEEQMIDLEESNSLEDKELSRVIKESLKSFKKLLEKVNADKKILDMDEEILKYKLAKHADKYALGLSIVIMAFNGQFTISNKLIGIRHPKIKKIVEELTLYREKI